MPRHRFAAALAAMIVFTGGAVLVSRLIETEPVTLPTTTASPEEPPATAPPVVARQPSPQYQTSTECPEMDNPGGLRWERSSNAGPFPTNGTIFLPSLDVAAPVVRVGVGNDGTMVVPRNARDVAWLDQGPIPGETNNVVLAGHISYSRQAGSFFRLRELAKGDKITLEMDGKHQKFQVVWNCFFDRDTAHAAQIMGKTEVPSVTLISCGGVFDSRAGTHTKRIAVRAEMIDPQPPEVAALPRP